MNHPRTRAALWAPIALIVAAGIPSQSVRAATFRVTSKIHQGAELEPAAETLVLFDEGLVYELPQIDRRFVTVYDTAQGLVTLLDRKTQVQATIKTDALIRFSAQVRAEAKLPQQQQQWGLNAQVTPSNRVIGYSIQFANYEYHTTTQTPRDASVATDYGRFADLAKRLDLVRRLGPPPFARMTLNDHVTKAREIPLETTLSIRREARIDEYRATHELNELTEADRKKIEEVRGMMTLYKTVQDLKDFPKS